MDEILEKLDRENIYLAGFGKRAIAFILDNFIVSLIIFIAFYKDFMSVADDVNLLYEMALNFVVFIFCLQFFYHFLFTAFYGATLGKMAVRIKIIDEQSLDKPNFMGAFIRTAVRFLSESAFYLGFTWAFGNELRKTWQDFAARTLVIDA